MRIKTRQELADGAAEAWREQCSKNSYYQWGVDKEQILEKLIALGPQPAPEAVDEAIGNGSWTRTNCHECEAENINVVQIGEEEDYESNTAYICGDCLKAALSLLAGITQG